MSWFVRVEGGVVQERIAPFTDSDGVEIPISERFTPEFVQSLINVDDVNPKPDNSWTYDGQSFSPPKPYQPSPSEIRSVNSGARDALLRHAALMIAPLQDAADLADSTPQEVAALALWKRYRIAVNRIDLDLPDPQWPATPDS